MKHNIWSYRSAYDELCIAQLFSGFVVFFLLEINKMWDQICFYIKVIQSWTAFVFVQ